MKSSAFNATLVTIVFMGLNIIFLVFADHENHPIQTHKKHEHKKIFEKFAIIAILAELSIHENLLTSHLMYKL